MNRALRMAGLVLGLSLLLGFAHWLSLGNYPNKPVNVGGQATVTADAAPLRPQRLTTTGQTPEQTPAGLAASDWASIRAAHQAWQHAFQPLADGDYTARNPGQQWRTRFDGRGFLVQPDGGAWQWGLELTAYGFPGHQHALPSAAAAPLVEAAGSRLAYAWEAGLREWFVNDQRGLEHGFTINERPTGSDNPQSAIRNPQLSFTLAVRGTLRPVIAPDGGSVRFVDAQGAPVVNYSGLQVWDAAGRVLPARFEPLATADSRLVTLSVEESGARYPLTIDPIAQQAYLKPAAVGTSQAGDQFGSEVAVSGDTVVVGANREDSSTTGVNSTPDESGTDSGAAYVFTRSGTMWTQQAYLKPAAVGTSQGGDQFGFSVAVSGDTVVVGAFLEDSSTTGVNSTPDDTNGFFFNAGAAYVFTGLGPSGAPEIAVEQPAGTDLSDGTASVSFGSVDSSADRTFTVKNTGTFPLTGLGLTLDGANAADFTVVASPEREVLPGGSTTFTLRFTPGSGGAKTAALHIASNDVDETPFDLTLTGTGNAPAFTACPMNQSVNADTNQCTAAVAFTATATGTPAPTVTCKIGTTTITSPYNFPVGASNVVCTASNGKTPDAACSFMVTVIDNQNPTITAPADKTVNADANSCAATGVALGTPTFGDNCTGASVSNNAPSSFPVGMTTVTWTVTDASGRTATATQKVTVNDNQNPTITAPADKTVNADANSCVATGVALGTPTFNDNCSGATVSHDAPSSFPKGMTTVTWTVTDASGRTATATQTVTVTDNQNPTITAPADKTVNADANSCVATNVNLGTPTFNDNCTGSSVSSNAPSSFPVGMTTVTWTVTDASGHTATATQKITVTAHNAPAVGTYGNASVAPGGNTTVTPTAAPTTTVSIMSVTAAASSNSSGGSFTGSFSGNTTTGAVAISNANPPGVYSVTVTVKDNCGTTTTRMFTLTVNSAPALTASNQTRQQGSPAANSQVATTLDAEDAETALVVKVDGGAAASSNGVTVSNLAINAAGQVTANIVASCTAINASFTLTVTDTLGGTASASLNVTVTANAQPSVGNYSNTVVAPGGSTMITPTAAPTDNGTIASVTATATPNNFSGTLTGNPATGALTIGNAGPLGGYSITVTITDNCGLSVTRSFMLTVSACGASLSKTSQSFAGNGGSDSFTVTVDTGCPWTAVSNNPSFITVTAPSGTSTASGTVSFNVANNPGTSARSGTITVAGQSFTVLQGWNFLDAPPAHAFYTEIGKLAARGITLGCGGGNYCPDPNVTREQMAALISRALGVFNPPTPSTQRFADVLPTNPFYAFIEEIAQRQITLGCGAGNFCPTANVTREQIAAFLVRALHAPGYVPPTPGTQRFVDVLPSNPFYAHIEELAMRQITLGCGGGNYCPAQQVTRATMAVFLVRAFNL
jgi:hypothetical protein